MNSINICIAGLGNVGSALVHLIEKNAELVRLKSELNINIVGLSAKNITKKRGCPKAPSKLVVNFILIIT